MRRYEIWPEVPDNRWTRALATIGGISSALAGIAISAALAMLLAGALLGLGAHMLGIDL